MLIRLKDLGLDATEADRTCSHAHEDCCELASVQRLARTPYIEELLGGWNGGCAVNEEPQPYLPIFEENDVLARTVSGGEEYGDKAKGTELLADLNLQGQEG